ncbi:hypothetical protein Salat_2520100 [Sesamum alatum]|uniref:Uncharacterized protein n=1 Tax=Sesamum alatum TaxID=300844 RepID=A0AAE2CCE2_9LAMI|nr:hypothetical protein Salat_2520100 [Sesamum alatum]
MERLHDLDGLVDWDRADWIDSRGSSYGSLGGLVVQSECVARMVDSKKRIRPLSVCDRGISYTLGHTFMLFKAVATVVGRTGNGFLWRCNEAYVVSSIKHRCLVNDGNRRPIPYPRLRPGDSRRKDSTRTESAPKCSHQHSPSL